MLRNTYPNIDEEADGPVGGDRGSEESEVRRASGPSVALHSGEVDATAEQSRGNASFPRKRMRVRVDRDTEVEIGAEEHSEERPERARGEKAKKIPRAPTAEEIRVHKATHCPFRLWCPSCVAARAHRSGHFKSEEPLDDTPMISFDYCFLRRGGSR